MRHFKPWRKGGVCQAMVVAQPSPKTWKWCENPAVFVQKLDVELKSLGFTPIIICRNCYETYREEAKEESAAW